MRNGYFVLLTVLLLGALSAAAARGAANGFPAYPEDLKFTPGAEIKVDDPQTVKGGLSPTDSDPTSHFVVYLPKDYDPARPFPVILCYHGMNQEPRVWPFKQITEEQGFIIIGMEYLRPACYKTDPAYEVGYVQRLIAWLKKCKVNVDPQMVFMAGFSQGGWHTAETCDRFAAGLAGVIICSAGRDANGPPMPAYRGKPVLISAGEKEDNRSSAETAAKYFRTQGAEVTLEIFPGKGHTVDTADKVMHQWFKDNGPARQARLLFAAAEKARLDGALGKAYTLYAGIAANPAAGDYKNKAGAASADIAGGAKAKLDEAEAAISARKYGAARKIFTATATLYAESPFAQTARDRSAFLDKDPAIRADIQQADLDSRADALEALGQGAEKKKDYAGAISYYEKYVSAFPTSHHIGEVKAHLAELKANPALVADANRQNADRDGKANIQMANNYIKIDRGDLARPLLEDLIKKYPGTDWAKQARQILATIH